MENYSAMKLESLALKWAVTNKYREYLIGNKFTVFTDNNPLSHLKTAKLGAIEQRWVSILARFDFDVVYRPGRENGNVDALSRQYSENQNTGDPSESMEETEEVTSSLTAGIRSGYAAVVSEHGSSFSFPVCSAEGLAAQQQEDPVIRSFLKYWRRWTRPEKRERAEEDIKTVELLRQCDKIEESNGVLYRRFWDVRHGQVKQMLLPQGLQGEVLQRMHDGHGHQGVERTFKLIRARYYWPGMYQEVERYCKQCGRCIVAKAPLLRIVTAMGSLLASKPFEVVAMDFTELERSSDGRENVLVLTDVFSKFTVAVPTKDQKATTVAKAIVKEWIQRYGVPQRLHLVQGMCFEAEIIQNLCKIYGIKRAAQLPTGHRAMGSVRGLTGLSMTCYELCHQKGSEGGLSTCQR
ncbi:hypothetical protein DPEC_G00073670 [Dallia pectoralis]|uniref:Uncharacterized protein n=1 Tax=Dallia pectoralis TaxID=75939 RepID=A0ACC2H329_DALPE|nr:hypothetical protein DPEC_G00073670 [Dallia pectoralis]